MKVFVYKCMYYHPDDEYGRPMFLEQKVELFKSREDAQAYAHEFESNYYRCAYHSYTVYESKIEEQTIL